MCAAICGGADLFVSFDVVRMCGTVFCVWKGDRIRAIFRDDG